jgi:hypothetical protein
MGQRSSERGDLGNERTPTSRPKSTPDFQLPQPQIRQWPPLLLCWQPVPFDPASFPQSVDPAGSCSWKGSPPSALEANEGGGCPGLGCQSPQEAVARSDRAIPTGRSEEALKHVSTLSSHQKTLEVLPISASKAWKDQPPVSNKV